MTDLLDNIGKGFRQYNCLHNKKEVKVYVEDDDDVSFWKHIFERFNIKTRITAQVDDTGLKRGKKNVLRFAAQAHEYFILCVDSDYDYLSDGATKTSKTIKENRFIFQTYTYSIENYKCFADSLHQLVVDATLNDNPIFDYKAFLEKYSEITYELFVYSFFYERKYQQEAELHQAIFSIEDFCGCIKILNRIDISGQGKQELAALTQKVDEKLASLPQIDEKILERLKKELFEFGLTHKNTYLFIQGHTIYDNVVLMFLKPAYQHLEKEKREEIKCNARTDEEEKNKKNRYRKDIAEIEFILRTHKNYQDCFLMSKIESDIKKYLFLNPLP